jgi:acetyl-CoA acetyltransferase
MGDAFVAGAAMTPFARHQASAPHRQGAAALRDALSDAGIEFVDLGLVVVGVVGGDLAAAPALAHEFPWTGVPALAVENASATGSAAFAQACAAVATGRVRMAAAVGFGSLARVLASTGPSGATAFSSPSAGSSGDGPSGDGFDGDGDGSSANAPALAALSGAAAAPTAFALLKRQRMYRWKEPDSAALRVVEKNLGNAAKNPLAQRRTPVALAELSASPMIADPLRRAECCPIGDGAAAVIVTSAAHRPDGRRSIRLAASVTGTDRWHPAAAFAPDPEITGRLARDAYRAADIGPDRLDVVEVHDAFSVEELQYVEDLGLCPPGQAGARLADGAFGTGTAGVAVSPSGGLLGRGHPGGATGLAQIVELTSQLRGGAGARQHPDAAIGLAHMIGAGGLCYLHVLRGES